LCVCVGYSRNVAIENQLGWFFWYNKSMVLEIVDLFQPIYWMQRQENCYKISLYFLFYYILKVMLFMQEWMMLNIHLILHLFIEDLESLFIEDFEVDFQIPK